MLAREPAGTETQPQLYAPSLAPGTSHGLLLPVSKLTNSPSTLGVPTQGWSLVSHLLEEEPSRRMVPPGGLEPERDAHTHRSPSYFLLHLAALFQSRVASPPSLSSGLCVPSTVCPQPGLGRSSRAGLAASVHVITIPAVGIEGGSVWRGRGQPEPPAAHNPAPQRL